MPNKPKTFRAYYSAVLIIMLVWCGLAIFYLHQPILPIFLLCLAGAFWGIRHLELLEKDELFDSQQKRLKRLESKSWYFESIVSNSKDIIFTTDLEHRIIKFNHGSEQAFGIPALEVLGKDVRSLFDDPDAISVLLEEVKEKGVANAIELAIKNKSTGESIWLSVTVSSLFDKKTGNAQVHHHNKQFLGDIFTCKNVTHRRMLEKELKDKNEQLTQLSITDSLTGLYNVRHLKTEATKLQKIHNRYPDRPLSLALIDVDKFKEYNDNFGHLAGDNLLVVLSKIIQDQIRKDLDWAFRYGGDEFVLLFPETNAKGCKIICDRILLDFVNQKLGATSLSIGITEYHKEWGLMSANLLVSKADEAMYTVKCRGGNGLHVYSTPLSEELAKREVIDDIKKLR